MKKIFCSIIIGAAMFPALAYAHQPRIVSGTTSVHINNPDVSQAFYGKLAGDPQIFTLNLSQSITFYMNVLVPDVSRAKADVSAALVKPEDPAIPVALLSGETAEWKPYFESFARDAYLKGPEIRKEIPPGNYDLIVWSSNNDSAYVLVVGEKESFPFSEIINAYKTLPIIKQTFFKKPAYTAYLTPVLGLPIAVAAVIVGGATWWGVRRYRKSRV